MVQRDEHLVILRYCENAALLEAEFARLRGFGTCRIDLDRIVCPSGEKRAATTYPPRYVSRVNSGEAPVVRFPAHKPANAASKTRGNNTNNGARRRHGDALAAASANVELETLDSISRSN